MTDPDTSEEAVTSTCNRSQSGGLPTIEYTTASGERRRVRYIRTPSKPWQTERQVDRPAPDDLDREWVPCGGEPLADLRIDGECRAAVSLVETLEDP